LAIDDARQATEAIEFWQKLDAMVAVTVDANKYYATRAQVLAAPHSSRRRSGLPSSPRRPMPRQP
jgi:hypothetical protein